MSEQNVQVFGWDDTIAKDSSFVLLPEGEYDFFVEGFERQYHQGSAKLPPCNKAVLTIRVGDPFGDSTVLTHNLFLCSKCEGLLCDFFTAIGDRKRGEALRPNWQAVVGKSGRCKLKIETWEGRDGEEKKSNRIERFLEPKGPVAAWPQAQQAPQPAAQPVVQQTVMQSRAPARDWRQGGF